MQKQSNIYNYVLYPGNGHILIQQALSLRNVWQPIAPDRLTSAQLIWKNLNFHQTVYSDFDEIMKYSKTQVLLNHFQSNYLVTTKSGLVRSLKYFYSHQLYSQNYHVFETIPTTFIIQAHKENPQLKDFYDRFNELKQSNFSKQKMPEKHCEHNVWFVKPESQNQGRGIMLTNNLKEIQTFINSKPMNTNWIVQKAVERPLLYQNRKFDIRAWVIVTPQFDIYFYNIPYMRTSSKVYNATDFTEQIHLTNNFQQKKKEDYSIFEKGNTIPLTYLKNYLEQINPNKEEVSIYMEQINKRMRDLTIDTFLSVKKSFLKNLRKKQFQLFGFDFLVDEDYRTWLLEVNNNPYLGTPNQFIKDLVPKMINQMFQIVLDPFFPPVNYTNVQQKCFQLIHREPPIFRINNIRGLSSEQRKKNIYPSRNQTELSVKKNRRNSEAIGSLQNSFLLKSKYSTPIQSIKSLLQNYCFNDYEPFFLPVTMYLTSNKLKEEFNQINEKNCKLITETRLAGILLESKFIQISKKIFLSQEYSQTLKAHLLNGYINSIKNYKHRISIIRNIIPIIALFMVKQSEEKRSLQLCLITNIIKLLIKVGGILDRKIFIPGQTRDSEHIRGIYIRSNCLGILIFLHEKHPSICQDQINQFFENFNSKDWQLYQSVKKKENNQNMDLNLSLKLQINIEAIEERQKINLTPREPTDFKAYRPQRQSLGFPRIKR